jgi:hypothetical protein
MSNSLSGNHSEKEKEHKERIRKLKAKTSKMRLAVSSFKPSTPTKRVPMDKEQKNQRRRLRDSIRKTEASNEAVRLKFNQMFYPGGGGAKPSESVLPPKRNYTKRRNKPTNESIP